MAQSARPAAALNGNQRYELSFSLNEKWERNEKNGEKPECKKNTEEEKCGFLKLKRIKNDKINSTQHENVIMHKIVNETA